MEVFLQGRASANPQRPSNLCALRGWVVLGTETALKFDVALSPLLALVMTSGNNVIHLSKCVCLCFALSFLLIEVGRSNDLRSQALFMLWILDLAVSNWLIHMIFLLLIIYNIIITTIFDRKQ